MADYLGVRCPVCNKKFSSGDDIVVCPACGAPHHRECYKIKGECVFQAEHITGKAWHAPNEASPGDSEPRGGGETRAKACASCGANNPPDGIFCNICGKRLDSSGATPPYNSGWQQGAPGFPYSFNPEYARYGGVSPEDTIDGINVRDMELYIGRSAHYYLPRFKHMNDSGNALSFNAGALFFGFFYFFYRKMYAMGIILLALFCVGSIPNAFYTREAMPIWVEQYGVAKLFEQAGITVPTHVDMASVQHYARLSNITGIINLIIGIATSFLANHIYYSKVARSIHDIRERYSAGESTDDSAYKGMLSMCGGTSKWTVTSVVIVTYLILNVISYYFVLGGVT